MDSHDAVDIPLLLVTCIVQTFDSPSRQIYLRRMNPDIFSHNLVVNVLSGARSSSSSRSSKYVGCDFGLRVVRNGY